MSEGSLGLAPGHITHIPTKLLRQAGVIVVACVGGLGVMTFDLIVGEAASV